LKKRRHPYGMNSKGNFGGETAKSLLGARTNFNNYFFKIFIEKKVVRMTLRVI